MALPYDELTATTHPHIMEYVSQNAYKHTQFLSWLKKKGNVIVQGGRDIQFPVTSAKLDDAESVAPRDARNTKHKELVTNAMWDWKYNKADITFLWDEMIKNKSKEAVISIMANRVDQGMLDLEEHIETLIFQPYASQGGTDIDTIFNGIRTAASVYAGITPSDVENWDCGVYDTSAISLALFGTTSLDALYQASWFREPPDTYITTKALASVFMSKLQPSERRTAKDYSAGSESGYGNLMFNGCEIVVAENAPTGTMLCGNSKSLKLVAHVDDNFKVGKWQWDPDLNVGDRCLLTFVGNLCINVRRQWSGFTNMS